MLKKILLEGLESSGMRYDGPLEFSAAAAAACARNHLAAKVSRVSDTALAALLTPPAFPLGQQEIVQALKMGLTQQFFCLKYTTFVNSCFPWLC